MRTIKFFGFSTVFIGLILLSTIPFQSCEPDDGEEEDTSQIIAYKPNIYIYPNEETQLLVSIYFPKGGDILTSVPEYGNGWNINVDTNGLIDKTYNYLFYESKQPDIWQKSYGWIIKQADLEKFFKENMINYGFYGNEIQDFIEYWMPRLIDHKFYIIYPQNSLIINKAIELRFSKEPEKILRLFYVVHGYYTNPNIKLTVPRPDKIFDRKGFFVTEWGVILK